jgi:TPR repeat protein
MKMPGRIILPVAMAALAASSLAQQSPGLSAKPTGRSLAEAAAPPAEQPVDLTRQNPRKDISVSTLGDDASLDSAMRGEAWAQTKLGKAYLEESDTPERRQKGIDLLKMAAEQKDAEALFVLATVSATEQISQPSVIDSVSKLKEAAEFGSADAQYEMAVMLMNDAGASELTKREAMEWARKAAYQGNAKAQHSAGITLLKQAANPEDAREGLSLLEKAAAQNHREALMVLAGILTRGEFGLAKDQKRAEALLLPRAKEGDAEFQFGLATLYLYGDQFVEAKDTGMSWLRHSADSGYIKSKNLLAKIGGGTAARAK